MQPSKHDGPSKTPITGQLDLQDRDVTLEARVGVRATEIETQF